MGIDWLVCDKCGEAFADCSPYESCEGCESKYCEYCVESQYEAHCKDSESLIMCDECSPNVVKASDILSYLLKKSGKSKEELEKEILESRKVEEKPEEAPHKFSRKELYESEEGFWEDEEDDW